MSSRSMAWNVTRIVVKKNLHPYWMARVRSRLPAPSPTCNGRQHIWRRAWSSSAETPPQQQPGKFRQFMKKYGPVGLGVYLALSVVDLGLTMTVISVKGAERVRQVEDWALTKAKGWVGIQHTPAAVEHEKPSFTSLFFIAYGIHKTLLLPVRLSLTAAITPPLAKKLRALGWIKNHIRR